MAHTLHKPVETQVKVIFHLIEQLLMPIGLKYADLGLHVSLIYANNDISVAIHEKMIFCRIFCIPLI